MKGYKGILIVLILLVSVTVLAQEGTKSPSGLTQFISEKSWNQLPPLFSDDSYKRLEEYFGNAVTLKFLSDEKDKWIYQVKYADYAETGILLVSSDEKGLYKEVKILHAIKPLSFINRYRRFSVQNVTFRLGDGEVHLKRGFLFRPEPSLFPLLFTGEWSFSITPGDEEERLTLKKHLGKENFQGDFKTGLFVLKDTSFLDTLPPSELFSEKEPPELEPLLAQFKQDFGFTPSGWQESWFVPFSENYNLLLFPKEEKGHYVYTFDPSFSPDTYLESDDNRLLLSYNFFKKKMRIQLQGDDPLERVHVSLYFDPLSRKISGTTNLSFQKPSSLRKVYLSEDLQLKESKTDLSEAIHFIRSGPSYYIMGPDAKELFLYYRGNLNSLPDPRNVSPSDSLSNREMSSFTYVNRNENYYPHVGNDFSATFFTISLPSSLNCLATGALTNTKKISDRTLYTFRSDKAKGISFITGQFKLQKSIKGDFPLHVYAPSRLNFERYYKTKEIRQIVDYLVSLYGPLHLKELNLLFRPWKEEGGLSHRGFIIFNVLPQSNDWLQSTRRAINPENPMALTRSHKEYLVHELSHQWWGGLVSWKSYRDLWITEGLPQFSSLWYLKETLPKEKWEPILRKVKNRVIKDSPNGPLYYGGRLANLSDNYEIYQTLIYNKTALLFLMLQEMLGTEDLFRRFRLTIESSRFHNLTTQEFVQKFTEGDKRLTRFFEGWVYSREVPEVDVQLVLDGGKPSVKVAQKNGSLLFPLLLEITTDQGSFLKSVVVDGPLSIYPLEESSVRRVAVSPLTSAPILLPEEGK